jgi:hypothetical protein
MTDEQINQAIAEACGWVPDCDRGICWDQYGNAIITPPNYCADLNAIHEAEKIMSKHHWMWNAYYYAVGAGVFSLHATARKKAEAFLKALGKWEEVQK